MLHIKSDKPNTNADSNRDHYNLGVMLMAAAVGPRIDKDVQRAMILERWLLLGLITRAELETYAKWLLSFGTISCNISTDSNTAFLKRCRENAQRDVNRAIREVRGSGK